MHGWYEAISITKLPSTIRFSNSHSANTVGSIMADARVTVKGVQAIDASFDEATLKRIVEQARMNVHK